MYKYTTVRLAVRPNKLKNMLLVELVLLLGHFCQAINHTVFISTVHITTGACMYL